MPTTDERIEAKAAAIIAAAIPAATVEGRKSLASRQGDTYPLILCGCGYQREQPGDSTYTRNVTYRLTVALYTRSDKAKTGDETINNWRELVAKALYSPQAFKSGADAVTEVNDTRATMVATLSQPQRPEGVDMQSVAFNIETYEN